jgi:hypothetical protein
MITAFLIISVANLALQVLAAFQRYQTIKLHMIVPAEAKPEGEENENGMNHQEDIGVVAGEGARSR